jgi:hypothetical protein
VDVVGERADAVDLDYRDHLAVARLELQVAVDRDLVELESQLLLKRAHLRERPLAEVAALSVIDGYTGLRGRAHA